MYLRFAIFISIFTVQVQAVENIRVIPPQSNYDASHNYFSELLQLSLDLTLEEYGAVEVVYSTQMEQGRALFELKRGREIDVYWAGTTIEREKELTPIRVPLVKGLLGFRVSLIRSDRINDFQKVKTLSQLQKMRACQGLHWPDSDILEYSGIPVKRGPIYELLFRQLDAGRCDFFPRGLHEAFSEIKARRHKYADMQLYSDLIIYYPFPMYFFVGPNDHQLASRIEKGLNRAIDNGTFLHHMKTHPVTSHLFPLDQWSNKDIIKLTNPFLAKDTPTHNTRYWFLPNK